MSGRIFNSQSRKLQHVVRHCRLSCLCLQLQSSQVAEHLVQSIIDASAVQEVIASATTAAGAASSTASQQHSADAAAAAAAMAAEFEVEMSRLRSRINHLCAQNTLLNVTLEESKCTCTRLAVLAATMTSCTALASMMLCTRCSATCDDCNCKHRQRADSATHGAIRS